MCGLNTSLSYIGSIVLEQCSLDDVHHDLVSSLEDLMDTEVSEEALNGVVLQVAISAVHLEAVVHDVEALVSGELFGHSAVHSVVGLLGGDHASTVSDHEPGGLQISCHSRKFKLKVLVGSDRSAKLLPALDVLSRGVDTGSSSSKRARSDVQSTAIKARQGNLESFSSFTNQV